MRRDNDYLRSLLFRVEDDPAHIVVFARTLDADAKEMHHVDLLCDAGLLLEVGNSTYRMTNNGHDYLEAIRDDTVWEKTKAGVGAIGGATLQMIADIAVAYLKEQAAAKLGIEL